MTFNAYYEEKEHGEKYIILDWAYNIITFDEKNIKSFNDLLLADSFLDKQIDKLSKSEYEKQILKDDYNNNYEKYFEEIKGEYIIEKCKNIFTNNYCGSSFSRKIN
jgi:hypothetical protein